MGPRISTTIARRVRSVLAAVASASALAGAMNAQAAPAATAATTTLSGVVTNLNGVPIPRVEVVILGIDLRAVSNDSGVYEFLAAPVGRVRMVARRIGFEPEEGRATLEPGRHKQVDFEMKGIPEQLDSVMIREMGGNGRMADFWARRMNGVGAFITRADIERRHPHMSSDLLRTVTGVKVSMGENTFERANITMGRNTQLSRSGRNSGASLANDCKVSYYVDGSSVPGGTFHMDDMSPLAIEAVEVYRGPAETPARFRQRDTACGVIVIWTREPPPKPPAKAPGLE
jgi:hypothetical protein